jgi:hypothetical protein
MPQIFELAWRELLQLLNINLKMDDEVLEEEENGTKYH